MDLFLPTGTVALPMAAAVPRCTGAEPRPVQWGSKKALLASFCLAWHQRRRPGMRPLMATDGPEDPIDLDIAGLIDSLQGQWEDDIGLKITVDGNEVEFNDGTGSWRLQADPQSLQLRGARFVGTPENPVWQFPNGVRRLWNRPEPIDPEQMKWREVFLEYKAARQQLRRQLWALLVAEPDNRDRAQQLRESWATGSVEEGKSLGLELQARLFAGRHIVPGVCFVHRRYGYRGVVLSCEPWCTANRAWKRMMGVSNLPRGEWQPFYHCLVDERDRPGGQVTFVGEENLTPDDDAAFPVQHPFIEPFLIRCDELKSYLPSPKLEEALSAQRDGDDFRLSL